MNITCTPSHYCNAIAHYTCNTVFPIALLPVVQASTAIASNASSVTGTALPLVSVLPNKCPLDMVIEASAWVYSTFLLSQELHCLLFCFYLTNAG